MAGVICETDRLILRTIAPEDIEYFVQIWSDPMTARYLGGVKAADETRLKMRGAIEHQEQRGFSRWSVYLKESGELIGLCGPLIREIGGRPEVELGYAFGREYWGFGYATEAARAALKHGERLGLDRVVAIIDSENEASIGVIGKCGLVFERIVDWFGRPVRLYATSPQNG